MRAKIVKNANANWKVVFDYSKKQNIMASESTPTKFKIKKIQAPCIHNLVVFVP